jgi:hypothetical protein
MLATLLPTVGLAAPTTTGTGSITFCGQTLPRSERYVHCHDARVSDIAPLAGLLDLEHLDLEGSRVASLEPLRGPHGPSGLRWVKLAGTPIGDLGPLQNHPYIERLDIDRTKVVDLAPLANHQSLTELSLNDTAVRSIEPVLGLRKLAELRFQRSPALTEASILLLARSKTIHMTGGQVRLLALFRLLDRQPKGLQVTRHPNGVVKEVGVRRQGRKDGWWAVFDERGDLLEEHDFWRGEPTRAVFNWSYNRYECVENRPHDNFVLRGCLLDHLTLTRAERLDVLKRAETLLPQHRDEVVRQLLDAAFVDDAQVREGIGNLLVRASALADGSRRRLPSREQLADALDAITLPLGKDFQGLSPEYCGLVPGKTANLTVSCSQFIGCAGGCQERIAHLTLTLTPTGARLASHTIGFDDRGLCGCCMHDM